MDWVNLFEEYKQWLSDNPTVYNVYLKSTSDGTIVPSIEQCVPVLADAFVSNDTCHITKQNNTKSVEGFISWLKYVKYV